MRQQQLGLLQVNVEIGPLVQADGYHDRRVEGSEGEERPVGAAHGVGETDTMLEGVGGER
jgi:hypothetical protein